LNHYVDYKIAESRSTSQSSSSDGFHVVSKSKKRVDKQDSKPIDEHRCNEPPSDPLPDRIYKGLVVSKDFQNNFYVYCPELAYEIQLAATELPHDLKISEFVDFKCNLMNTYALPFRVIADIIIVFRPHYYSRPSAQYVRRIGPLHKCTVLKNSVNVSPLLN
jgi:hypothetical protein